FVKNFNMHCVGKTMTELHALLIDYEKGLKDKVPTPQVLTIQKGWENKPKSQANKKDKSKGKTDKNKKVVPYQPKHKHNPLKRKQNPNKDQTCHHCHIAGHWKRNCSLYLEELRKNKDKAEHGAAASSNLFTIELFNLTYKLNSWVYDTGCAVEAIGVFDLVLPSGLVQKLNNYYYAPPIVRGVVFLSCLLDLGFNHTIASNGISVSLNGLFYFSVVSVNEVELQLGKKIKALRFDRGGYPKETMGYYFYFQPENKVIVARHGNFLERDLISQKFSGRDNDLEDDHMDTLPSENTSEIPVESESLGSPPELNPVRRSERTTRAPNRLCLNIEVEDDEVGDLGEPANYKAAMLDPDRVIWKGAMDKEMNSMKFMKVWIIVDLPPNADIRAIRILIAITAYYDYEIWKMDVKTAFLHGRLDEDIYMKQP
nr:hypothetical protein [Tanacetum cinerariifolium]